MPIPATKNRGSGLNSEKLSPMLLFLAILVPDQKLQSAGTKKLNFHHVRMCSYLSGGAGGRLADADCFKGFSTPRFS